MPIFRGLISGGADLQEANLYKANLQGANLNYANLQEVNLKNVYLREAKLYWVNLGYAYLLGAKKLTREQLCEAWTLYRSEIDEDLHNEIEIECPDKLTEESYDKWVKIWEGQISQKEQEKAEEENLSVQGKLIKIQEEILEIQKALLEETNQPESSE